MAKMSSPVGRLSAASSTIRHAGAGATALDIWTVALPALSFLQFQLGGQLIASELLALAILPWLLRTRARVLVPTWLIGLLAAWLAFQVVTDIVVLHSRLRTGRAGGLRSSSRSSTSRWSSSSCPPPEGLGYSHWAWRQVASSATSSRRIRTPPRTLGSGPLPCR